MENVNNMWNVCKMCEIFQMENLVIGKSENQNICKTLKNITKKLQKNYKPAFSRFAIRSITSKSFTFFGYFFITSS